MHENDIEKLLRVGRALEDKKAKLPTKSSETFYYTKRTIEEICKSLSVRIDDYSPENTVKIIENYLKNEDKINRLLYSHLSNCVFALDENGKGLFATNVENLMLYTISRKDISEDCQKIVIKIYDHFHLALHQTEKINKTFADSFADNIKDTADNLKTEIKGIEREYTSNNYHFTQQIC